MMNKSNVSRGLQCNKYPDCSWFSIKLLYLGFGGLLILNHTESLLQLGKRTGRSNFGMT